MPESTEDPSGRRPRADAQRNRRTLVDAAATVFVRAGVDAPVRDVAAEAGVGMGTVYRHFPSRADLIVAVYRHQLDGLADVDAARTGDPFADLRTWVHQLTGFLSTKHGLANALRADQTGYATLHAEFLDRLVPVLEQLLNRAAGGGQVRAGVRPYDLLRAVGNLCIGIETDERYHAEPMIDLLLDGLAATAPLSAADGESPPR